MPSTTISRPVSWFDPSSNTGQVGPRRWASMKHLLEKSTNVKKRCIAAGPNVRSIRHRPASHCSLAVAAVSFATAAKSTRDGECYIHSDMNAIPDYSLQSLEGGWAQTPVQTSSRTLALTRSIRLLVLLYLYCLRERQ